MSVTATAQTEALVVGEGVRIRVEFTDVLTGQLADPITPVTVTVDPPDDDPPPAARLLEATRQSRGVYVANVAGDVAGWWAFRGESAGPVEGRGVVEGVFEVKASRLR